MNPRDVKAITLRSGASYPEPKGTPVLANSESSTSRSPGKRKMKRSTSGKGVDVESVSKKNSALGTIKEIDTPDTKVSRPDSSLTSGKRNLAPPKEKVKDKDLEEEDALTEAIPFEEDSTLTSKAEICQDQNFTENALVVIYDLETVREIEHNWGGTNYEEELAPGQEEE
ncbi:hypothetical protein Dimus_024418, partial [Dionaea muscipula]